MLRALKRKLKRLRRYRRAVAAPGCYHCFLDELLDRSVRRTLRIGGAQIEVRTHTPDLDVAISSLVEQEYAHLRVEAPRFIVDAGANIGTSAIFFARRYPEATIVAVEPEDENFELLKRNTAPFPNVVPVKAAIWGRSETRPVMNRHTGPWGYTVSDSDQPADLTGQRIDCVTVEHLMRTHGAEAIDLMKMDIEGGEKDVLENAAGWIDKVSVMTVELHDRICMGCARAFYLATKDFARFEKHGEKVTTYRH
jgi:FkbM family methyltransferase